MDLNQRKLNKTEWNNIEVPVLPAEKEILKLIIQGYHNVQYKKNNTLSLLGYLKTTHSKSELIDDFIYYHYFKDIVDKLCEIYNYSLILVKNPEKKIKKADMIRIKNSDMQIENVKDNIYEYILLDLIQTMLKDYKKKENGLFLIIQFIFY